MAVSSSQFRAAEAGQLSLFGAHTGVTESVSLPLVPDADRRETLNWERELIGMYMSEHPLTPYLNEIRRVVSYFSSNLGEAAHEEKVRVAGMVSGIRPHQTKTGKMMAWVTLEDLTGTIELVVFPRTWEKYQFALEIGGVILAEGKVDAQSNPSKVLVDNIRTEIKLTEPASSGTAAFTETKEPAQMHQQPQDKSRAPDRKATTPINKPAALKGIAERRPGPIASSPDGDWPPPPEDPPDWDSYVTSRAGSVTPDLVAHEADLAEEQPLAASDQLSADERVSESGQSPIPSGQDIVSHRPSIDEIPPVIVPPTPKLPVASVPANLDTDHPPQMLTVILRPTGDPQRDIRRISRLHGTFISYPGKDRFAFQIFENERGHLIEFPNDTTHLCAELLTKIKDAVGEENLRVEPILYQ